MAKTGRLILMMGLGGLLGLLAAPLVLSFTEDAESGSRIDDAYVRSVSIRFGLVLTGVFAGLVAELLLRLVLAKPKVARHTRRPPPNHRIWIRKALAIPAAYLVWFGLWGPGDTGTMAALYCGTTTAAIIVFARRSHLPSICQVTIGGSAGALIGARFLGPVLTLAATHGYDLGCGETENPEVMGAILGTVVGAFLLCRTSDGDQPLGESMDSRASLSGEP